MPLKITMYRHCTGLPYQSQASRPTGQGVLKLMSDKDFNRKARKVREENRLIFAFLAVSLTKNQETRLDFEKALNPSCRVQTRMLCTDSKWVLPACDCPVFLIQIEPFSELRWN